MLPDIYRLRVLKDNDFKTWARIPDIQEREDFFPGTSVSRIALGWWSAVGHHISLVLAHHSIIQSRQNIVETLVYARVYFNSPPVQQAAVGGTNHRSDIVIRTFSVMNRTRSYTTTSTCFTSQRIRFQASHTSHIEASQDHDSLSWSLIIAANRNLDRTNKLRGHLDSYSWLPLVLDVYPWSVIKTWRV